MNKIVDNTFIFISDAKSVAVFFVGEKMHFTQRVNVGLGELEVQLSAGTGGEYFLTPNALYGIGINARMTEGFPVAIGQINLSQVEKDKCKAELVWNDDPRDKNQSAYVHGQGFVRVFWREKIDEWLKKREDITDVIIDTEAEDSVSRVNNKIKKERKIAPKKEGHFDKWVTVWNRIGHRARLGDSAESLIDYLVSLKKHDRYRGPIFEVDTMRKIIRAGKAGELETS